METYKCCMRRCNTVYFLCIEVILYKYDAISLQNIVVVYTEVFVKYVGIFKAIHFIKYNKDR